MTLSLPRYRNLTELPGPIYLEHWRASIVRPITRTNLVTNPSAETATTGYTAVGGSIARSTTESYHGAYSIAVTPTAGTTDGVFYGTVSLTSGTTYAASVKIKVPNAAGRKYRIAFATTGATMLQTTEFYATGYWQWVTVLYTETSSTTRRIYVSKSGGTETAVFYIDGLQVEACEAGNQFATTYIDGDQRGLLGDLESTPAYYWTGTPHASTSVRSGQTRAGGQVVKLANYGFFLTAIIGLGLAPVESITTNFGQLDGSQFLDQRNASRQIVLNGRWQASTARQQERQMANLANDLSRDAIATRQPLTLLFEPMDNDLHPLRAPLAVPGVSYIGGLEGNVDGLPIADTPISFTQYIPLVLGGDNGSSLLTQSSPTFQAIGQRDLTGQWATMAGGMSGGTIVYALAYGLDGSIFAGGQFTDAGGSGADNIARWDGSAWNVLGSAGALNGAVSRKALKVNAAGLLYVGGAFTNASGIANADAIATWDGTNWAALSTGANGTVQAIAIGPDGTVYAGGEFTTIGGVALGHIAKWNGTAWSALGSGVGTAGGATPYVYDIAVDQAGNVYIAGSFATVDGVAAVNLAKWNGTAWVDIGGAAGGNFTLAITPDQKLYVGGSFTTMGGVNASRIAVYNGVSWAPLGAGVSNTVYNILPDNKGGLYVTGIFATAGGITMPADWSYWNGSAWTVPDAAPQGNIYALLIGPDGKLTVGTDVSSITTGAGVTTITNGAGSAYPVMTITNNSAVASVRVFTIRNITTGKSIYLNLTLLVSETVVFTLDPVRISLVSNVRGSLLNTILPGSDTSNFVLQRGTNYITAYADTLITARISWPVSMQNLTDGWTK